MMGVANARSVYDREYFEGRKSNYWWTVGNYDNLRDAPHWEHIIRTIRDIKEKGRLLDIGCAYGFLVDMASPYFETCGIDVSSFAIKKSKEFCDSNVLIASATSLPFREDSFHIITVIDTLEHVPEPTECIREIHRILKRQGILFLQLPNPLVWRSIGLFNLKDEGHSSEYWLEEWKKVLSKNHLKIEKHYGILMNAYGRIIKRAKFFLKSKRITWLFPHWWFIARKNT